MTTAITVITVTRARPALLLRAIESVCRQDYRGRLEHLILIDECPVTTAVLHTVARQVPGLSWRQIPRSPHERSGPPRLARLRNAAVRLAATPWVAFLDDDNQYEESHLSSLLACAQATGFPAVHSERTLQHPDGSPYLEPRMPWERDPAEGRRIYAQLRDKGVFVPGSNVVHDRADPQGHPAPVRMVDTSEWLFSRELLLDILFCEQYSLADWEQVIPEDNKLLRRLIAERVPIASSRLPTLSYRLGGYSNAFARDTPLAWECPESASPVPGIDASLGGWAAGTGGREASPMLYGPRKANRTCSKVTLCAW